MVGFAAVRTLKASWPAHLLQGLPAFLPRPAVFKQLRQTHTHLNPYRIHLHNSRPVRALAIVCSTLLIHRMSLTEQSC